MEAQSSAPAALAPSSSNGDAAESLRAMFAKSADPFAEPTDISDDAAQSMAKLTAPSSSENAAWRLKFLHKVGVPPKPLGPQAAHEAPPELGRTPTPPPSGSSSSEADGGAGAEEETIVVRQAAPRGRSTEDIRSSYIKKLENSRAFIPQLNRPKQSQTVTIFDWDDTLLCTSARQAEERLPLPLPLPPPLSPLNVPLPVSCSSSQATSRWFSANSVRSLPKSASSYNRSSASSRHYCNKRARSGRPLLLQTRRRAGCSTRRACACPGCRRTSQR